MKICLPFKDLTLKFENIFVIDNNYNFFEDSTSVCITHFLSDQLIFWGLARMWLIYYENNCYSWEHIRW